ncbi:lachesin-like [Panulirus ornatus]|uniref:lachesin-like n=1 Tax=Panulirus ornatus TaxID=150431 RepID=UPI003A844D15
MLLPTLVAILVPILGSDVGVSNSSKKQQQQQQQQQQQEGFSSKGVSGGRPSAIAYPLGVIYNPDLPYFDLEESANVTALLGKTAVLNCRVKNIGNRTVSWVRHRDIHLLSVGGFTYTSDQRFSARHTAGSQDWLLMIHYLQRRDAGTYECQVSTTPPIRHSIHLSVVEPETVIEGGPDVHIDTGSRLALTCSVRYSPEPPAFIFWYHNDKLVSYDRTRGGVVVSTEKGLVTTSRLLVQFAKPRHSGVYTCAPANSRPRSVTVHVIADQPAAVVHDNSSAPHDQVMVRPVIFAFLVVWVVLHAHHRLL